MFRTVIGTFEYMPPEMTQCKDKILDFGEEIDIYSFGLVLWELFSGNSCRAFLEKNQVKGLFRKIRLKMPQWFPPWLTKLILCCTSANPQKRPSISDIRDILDQHKNPPSMLSEVNRLGSGGKKKDYKLEDVNLSYQWQWRKRGAQWIYLPVDKVMLLESLIQSNEKECTNISIPEISSDPVIFNTELFTASTTDSKIIQLHRRRVSDIKTKTGTLLCSLKEENDSLSITFKGSKIDDCSDLVHIVMYTYLDESDKFKLDFSYNYPFTGTIPIIKGNWIHIRIEFHSLFPVTFDYELGSGDETRTIEYKCEPRHLTNRFNNFQTGINLDELKNQVESLARMKLNEIIPEILPYSQESAPVIRNSKGKARLTTDVYLGYAGYAYFFWKLANHEEYKLTEKRKYFLEHALQLILLCNRCNSKESSSFTFLTGIGGILAMQAVITSDNNMIDECSNAIDSLLSISDYFIIKEMFENELFYGFSGYMQAILFVIAHVPKEYYNLEKCISVLHKCFKILHEGDEYIIKFSFRNAEQLGAAHGLAGILFIMLHIPELALKEEYSTKILNSIHFLIKYKGMDGSFPSGIARSSSSCYWCHGSPGVIPTLLKAYEVFKDEKYLTLAKEATDEVWNHGLSKKGFNLCHGIFGNVYPFLQLYSMTKDEQYLYRAYQFTLIYQDNRTQVNLAGHKDVTRLCIGTPDHKLSLMEGITGQGCFFVDMLSPDTASFPGYWNDIVDCPINS